MPAILAVEDRDAWLSGSTEEAGAVLRQYPSDTMLAHPVSTRVNAVKTTTRRGSMPSRFRRRIDCCCEEEREPRPGALSRAPHAASTSAARSHSPLLMRTSSRIEVIRRVRTSRPLAERRVSPPPSKFSCTRFRTL